MSGNDWVHLDGHVHDHDRIDFIHRYLLQMERAVQDGVVIKGYFHWSLMDNFEWARGFSERFGLVHVDFQTGIRTIKDSGFAYNEIIRRNTAR
jgi:beta-glucosidase